MEFLVLIHVALVWLGVGDLLCSEVGTFVIIEVRMQLLVNVFDCVPIGLNGYHLYRLW